jgi:hypothetical protein
MLMSESFNHLSKNNNINIMKERDRERWKKLKRI